MSAASSSAGVQIVLHDTRMDPARMGEAFPLLKREGCVGAISSKELLSRRREEPLTVVFAASDEMAIGVLRCLHADGWRVPEDVSVIGFDNIRLAHMVTPTLTTVAQPFEEIGAAAVETLLQLLNGRDREEVAGTHFLAHRVVPRESVQSPAYDSS